MDKRPMLPVDPMEAIIAETEDADPNPTNVEAPTTRKADPVEGAQDRALDAERQAAQRGRTA